MVLKSTKYCIGLWSRSPLSIGNIWRYWSSQGPTKYWNIWKYWSLAPKFHLEMTWKINNYACFCSRWETQDNFVSFSAPLKRFAAPRRTFSCALGVETDGSHESIGSIGIYGLWAPRQPTKYWNILGLFWFSKYWKNIWHLLTGPYTRHEKRSVGPQNGREPSGPRAQESEWGSYTDHMRACQRLGGLTGLML